VIDVRRHFACGIGRVSLNLAAAAIASRDAWGRLVLLTTEANRERVASLSGRDVEVVVVDYPFFSRADLYELPRLLATLRADVFVAPQFYISPFIDCATVKMVHDLWPIEHDQWLPSEREMAAHFGRQAVEGASDFLRWFEQNRATLPSWNEELQRRYEVDQNVLRRYAIAMICAAIDTAAIVPTCSWFSRSEITRLFPAAEPKLHVIYPFVTPVETAPKRRRFSFLHVGKFEPRKNHQLVCEAFIHACRRLPAAERADASLTLIGDVSYRRHGSAIVDFVREAAQHHEINFLGITSEGELWRRYADAYAFVFPSEFEGFGIPVIEAMSVGTPVITADRGGTREAAGGAALLIERLDTETLADAMLELWRDAALHEQLRRRGYERAAAFTFEQTVAQFREVVYRAAFQTEPGLALETS
jgi:glycosyltransferase involved in cell wall biosynthesis